MRHLLHIMTQGQFHEGREIDPCFWSYHRSQVIRYMDVSRRKRRNICEVGCGHNEMRTPICEVQWNPRCRSDDENRTSCASLGMVLRSWVGCGLNVAQHSVDVWNRGNSSSLRFRRGSGNSFG
mmetsp:Transcript_8688/g.17632  ORF Transcript_8688/g.17632 Transcript_8688/m.17632 type:complete len:123 (-) Transcript_8688:2742-3110(-)